MFRRDRSVRRPRRSIVGTTYSRVRDAPDDLSTGETEARLPGPFVDTRLMVGAGSHRSSAGFSAPSGEQPVLIAVAGQGESPGEDPAFHRQSDRVIIAAGEAIRAGVGEPNMARALLHGSLISEESERVIEYLHGPNGMMQDL